MMIETEERMRRALASLAQLTPKQQDELCAALDRRVAAAVVMDLLFARLRVSSAWMRRLRVRPDL